MKIMNASALLKDQSILTNRQKEVLSFVAMFNKVHERPPTRAEIAAHFGFKSANAAQEHLKALEKKGFLRVVSGTSRGIELK